MARHNRKLSFTTPIIIGFAGILFSFLLIAVFATTTQRNDFLEDYHHINRNFTHNMATNYTETLLQGNDFILTRAATFFARNDALNEAVNVNPEKGLMQLMQLQNMMQTVSSISKPKTASPSMPKQGRGLLSKRKPVPSVGIPARTTTTSRIIRRLPSTNP